MKGGERAKLIQTFKLNLEKILPYILIVLIIEGTFAGISWVFLLCFLSYKVYVGVKAADKAGLINSMGEQMFKGKKK